MRPLSATEAITPAIEHTKALLCPFSLKPWLKIGLVAVFAEMGGQFIAPPIGNPGLQGTQTSGIGAISGGVTLLFVVAAVFIAIVGFLIGLALLYLGSRLQLVLMDLVATRTTLVGPAWHRTVSRAWRWFGLKLISFLAILAVIGAIAAIPVIYFIRSMPANNAQPPTAAFFGSIALFVLTIFLLVMILMVAIWILRDFVLPFILLEDASIGSALRSAVDLMRRETSSVLLYLLLKFALSLIIGIAAEICIALAALIIAIPTGLVAGIAWFVLHHAGPFGLVIMYLSFGLLGAIFLVAFLIVITCVIGAVLTFYQAYALYFLGGRYPLLGNLLEPPPPPALPIFEPAS